MISTANYVARRWGVRSAMPGFVGQALCRRGPEFGMPHAELIFVRPDFRKYTAVAEIARDIFREYDPRFRAGSLDEAYLDLSEYLGRRHRLGTHEAARFSAAASSDATSGDVAIGAPADTAAGEPTGGPRVAHAEPSLDEGSATDGRCEGITIDESEMSEVVHDESACEKRANEEGGSVCDESEAARDAAQDGAWWRLEPRLSEVPDARGAWADSAEVAKCGGGGGAVAWVPPVSSAAAIQALAWQVVDEIRKRVQRATGGLTSSAGLGHNFLLAKTCADQRKPDGQFCAGWSREAVLDFLRELPVRKIGGVGRVLEKELGAIGVRTAGELLAKSVEVLAAFSDTTADWLLRVALGWADVESKERDDQAPQKGISSERTFKTTGDHAEQHKILSRICDSLAAAMASRRLKGRTLTLKLKTDRFDVLTRDVSGARPISTAADLLARAAPLLRREQDVAAGGVGTAGMAAAGVAVGGVGAAGLLAAGATTAGVAAGGVGTVGMAAAGVTTAGVTTAGVAATGALRLRLIGVRVSKVERENEKRCSSSRLFPAAAASAESTRSCTAQRSSEGNQIEPANAGLGIESANAGLAETWRVPSEVSQAALVPPPDQSADVHLLPHRLPSRPHRLPSRPRVKYHQLSAGDVDSRVLAELPLEVQLELRSELAERSKGAEVEASQARHTPHLFPYVTAHFFLHMSSRNPHVFSYVAPHLFSLFICHTAVVPRFSPTFLQAPPCSTTSAAANPKRKRTAGGGRGVSAANKGRGGGGRGGGAAEGMQPAISQYLCAPRRIEASSSVGAAHAVPDVVVKNDMTVQNESQSESTYRMEWEGQLEKGSEWRSERRSERRSEWRSEGVRHRPSEREAMQRAFVEMGFSESAAREALEQSEGDPTRALDVLIAKFDHF